MSAKIKRLTQAAVIAALYVALGVLQNLLLPGSASMAIQFRVAEALCVLSLFTPTAIWGLSVGCLLFNLTQAGALPLDFLVGTAATAFSALSMYALGKCRWRGSRVLALLMPALWNGLLVGWELSVYVGGGFWINALYVAIGEAVVLLVLGSALYAVIKNRKLDIYLFGE